MPNVSPVVADLVAFLRGLDLACDGEEVVVVAEEGLLGVGVGVGVEAEVEADFFSRLSFAMRSSIALGVAPAGGGGEGC